MHIRVYPDSLKPKIEKFKQRFQDVCNVLSNELRNNEFHETKWILYEFLNIYLTHQKHDVFCVTSVLFLISKICVINLQLHSL